MRDEWISRFAALTRVAGELSMANSGIPDEGSITVEVEGIPVRFMKDGALHLQPGFSDWGGGIELGGNLYFYGRLPSTNNRLRDLLAEGVGSGCVVVAREQTAGKGRHGRRWYSPQGGGLYVSLLLQPVLASELMGWVTLAAALALVRISKPLGASLKIKWPNDLECEGRKVAGILAEVFTEGEEIKDVVLGTGVNINWGKEEVPADISDQATTLSLCTGSEVDIDLLLASYLWEVWNLVEEMCEAGNRIPPAFASEVMAQMECLGDQVSVRTEQGKINGICTGLTLEGHLQLNGGRSVVTGELVTFTGKGNK